MRCLRRTVPFACALLALLALAGSAQAATPSGFTPFGPPGGFENAIPQAVDATGPPSVVWVAGYLRSGTEFVPFIERGHDGAWEIPILPVHHGALADVDALSGHDVWAVGWKGLSSRRGLILAWDGSGWTEVPAPPHSRMVVQISRRSPTDAYALDIRQSIDCVEWRLSHWDGVGWTRVGRIESLCEDGPQLHQLAAIRRGPVVLPGYLVKHEEQFVYPIWQCFRRCPSQPELPPDPAPAGGMWSGVAGVSGSDIWTVGGASISHSPFAETVVGAHWNGTSWTTVQTSTYTLPHRVVAVAELSSTSAWAVGSRETVGGTRTLIVHLTGTAIEDLGGPNTSTVSDELVDIAHVPGTASEMWAVGFTDTGQLLLHHP